LLDCLEQLTPAEHQTHRRYTFHVPAGCSEVRIRIGYSPKFLSVRDSAELVQRAVTAQVQVLTAQVGGDLADDWSRAFNGPELIIPNLLTVSVDDADGVYRGAGHRHAAEQSLVIGVDRASPGFVAGALPAGEWALTVSAHTVLSTLDVAIQIGAVTAAS
jgi:hypothetical protein